jgi:hypothetical protein
MADNYLERRQEELAQQKKVAIAMKIPNFVCFIRLVSSILKRQNYKIIRILDEETKTF